MTATDAPMMPPVKRLLALDTLTLCRVVLAMVYTGAKWRDASQGNDFNWKLIRKPADLIFAMHWRSDLAQAWWEYGLPAGNLNPAVLHKHARGPLAPLITPLLERINKEGLDK